MIKKSVVVITMRKLGVFAMNDKKKMVVNEWLD
jgi:hypothetical protein